MAIDLKNLPPFPWRVKKDREGQVVVDANDKCIADTWFLTNPTPGHGVVSAEFIALAGNAFDVMMRRRWYVHPYVTPARNLLWKVCFAGSDSVMLSKMPKFADDPFTALVAADKWYRENVEAGAQSGRNEHGDGSGGERKPGIDAGDLP